MAMFMLRSPFDLFEHQPHFLCRRRPVRIVQRCSEKSQSCRGIEIVKKDSNNFEVQLDMKNFEPEEICVKVIGREVTIEAESEKKTENSFESQRFLRKFNIPEGCNIEDVVPTINKEGLMTITVTQTKIEESKERVVPIQISSEPVRKTIKLENKDDGSEASTSK